MFDTFMKDLKSDNKNRSIIPTKFSCEIDGIGGLVIGNIFKIPKKIIVLDRLPINAIGKIERNTLAGIASQIEISNKKNFPCLT